MFVKLILSTIFLLSINASVKDYSGYRVIRLSGRKHEFESLGNVLAHGKDWVDIIVDPLYDLELLGREHQVMIHNIQDHIDRENLHRSVYSMRLPKFLSPTADNIFKDYQDYDVLVAFFDRLPLLSRKKSIGSTHLGREIYAFEFGTGKKRIIIHGGIHAREWIAPAVVTWIAHWLNSGNSSASQLLNKYTWSIIPVLNVDGYDYTRTNDRMWRKNRQPIPGSSCVGIDPNRNFGFEWGTGGSSNNACADDFKGYAPSVAPCTIAITEYVGSFPKGEVIAYFDFHSYSQLWLFPFGYNCRLKIPEFDIVARASQIATSKIQEMERTKFVSGPICATIYKASGSSTDHMYSMGVPFSFGVELRDRGHFGFFLRKILYCNI